EGQVVRVVLVLVLKIDRSAEPRGPAVGDDARRRKKRDLSVRRVGDVGVGDAAVVGDSRWIADVLVDEEELVERAGVQSLDGPDEVPRKLAVEGERRAQR